MSTFPLPPPFASPGFLASALASDGRFIRTGEIFSWLESRRRVHQFSIRQIPWSELDSWSFDSETGNLRHVTGRFFTVEGLNVSTDYPTPSVFYQPIMNQPEIGILGILAKRFEGVLHFLMQAKMEPGNINLVQLSPTVQATKSNYTQVHRGRCPRYLEYFIERSRGRVLVDQLQSEQGSFFLRKRNRNIIVETEENVQVYEDFCWMTLGQLKAVLQDDNLVNMDTRTVISSIPLVSSEDEAIAFGLAQSHSAGKRSFEGELVTSTLCRDGGLSANVEIISWLTELKAMAEIQVQQVPLNALRGWQKDDLSIYREDRRFFAVIAVSVEADTREVPGWSQPIVCPCATGITAFVTRRIDGVLHFLVQARMEPGIFDMFEMAPTIQYLSGSGGIGPADMPPPFLDLVANAPRDRIRYESLQSEEGGRFYHYQNRNVVIEINESEELELPRGYIWMTLGQIHEFLQHNNYFNIEARGLLACLGVGAP
jgi:oxidase EvaA